MKNEEKLKENTVVAVIIIIAIAMFATLIYRNDKPQINWDNMPQTPIYQSVDKGVTKIK